MRVLGRTRVGAVTAALLVLAGIAVAAARAATSTPSLPPIPPDRLVASALRAMANPGPVSGYVRTHVDLGIPSLPEEGPAGTASTASGGLLSALTGDHRLRVWRSTNAFRISDLLVGSERSLFVTRTDAWAWDFGTLTAYHLGPFPAESGGAERGLPPRGAGSRGVRSLDPLEAARQALASISRSTAVTEGRPARVAGRPVYVLLLTPRTSATLVGRVEVDLDAARRLPLRVAVYARGARAAAVSVAYTSIGFGPIDPSVFRFRPPPGAVVKQPSRRPGGPSSGAGWERDEYGPGAPIEVFGKGWASIVALRVDDPRALQRAVGPGLLKLLPYSGPLLSIRLVERGDHSWLVYGAVPQAALGALLPRLH